MQKFATRKPEDEFVGAWKLTAYEIRTVSGQVSYPMGRNPVGRITYDSLGRMSVQIMNPDRPKIRSDADKAAAFDGYLAYYGSYTVNPADHSVTHHMEASLNPGTAGSDLRRLYEFTGSQLILRGAVYGAGGGSEAKIVWERFH
jgi:hypothetical protein